MKARWGWGTGLAVLLWALAAAPARADGLADEQEAVRLLRERTRLSDEGRWEEAIPVSEALVALRERLRGADHADTVEAVRVLAWERRATGDYAAAEALYARAVGAIEAARRTGTQEHRLTLRAQAELYREKGDRERAEPIYERLLAIAEQDGGPDSPAAADALVDLAVLRREAGDPAGAVPLLLRALDIVRRRGDPEVVQVTDAGEEGIRDASSAPRQGEGRVLLELARARAARGDAPEAEARLAEVLRLADAVGQAAAPRAATALNDLGVVRTNAGDLAGAEEALRRSLALREQIDGPDHPRVAVALHHLSRARLVAGDAGGAEALARRALAILERTHGPALRRTADTALDLAVALAAEGRAAEAIPLAARAAAAQDRDAALVLAVGSEAQKRAVTAALRPGTDALLSIGLDAAPGDRAAARLALEVTLRRKGRVLDALTDGIAAVRAHLTPDARALLDRLGAVSARLAARAALAGDVMSGADRTRIEALAAERRRIEAEISATSAAFRAEQGLFAVDDVARALPEGAALVEIVLRRPYRPVAAARAGAAPAVRPGGSAAAGAWGPPRYTALALSRGGDVAAIDLGEAAAADAAARALREALADPDLTHDPRPAARALDEVVFRPVRARLGGARAVFVSPDGPLDLVPLGALADEEGRWLAARYDFTYLGSGRDLLRFSDAPAAPRGPALVVAAPAFGPPGGQRIGFVPLPGSAREAAAVAAAVPGARVLLGADATEAAVKRAAGPLLVHMASHGFFLPAPASAPASSPGPTLAPTPLELAAALSAPSPLARAGIALAGANLGARGGEDGILTALEASALDLGGTRLAVLSACETGIGDALAFEGVYGLRRALSMAGAETQVLSLWHVDSGATRALMERYYARLAAGMGRSAAMAGAQRAMLADPGQAHPNLWAGFVVSGSPRALDGSEGRAGFAEVRPGPRGCACALAGDGGEEGAPGGGPAIAAAIAAALGARRRRSHAMAGSGSARRRPARIL